MILNIVFGGAGFIGTNLCSTLLEKNQYVMCYDNFITGSREHCQWIKARWRDRYDFRELDITNNDSMNQLCKKLCKKQRKDYELYIYNLAGIASPIHYQEQPMKTFLTSTVGVENVCDLALSLGVPMLFTSTSEVYGDPKEHPQSEDYKGNVNTMGPRSCYDEGKRAAETIIYMYQQKGGNFKVARLFNTYGPYMDINDGRFISNFICQLLRGERMTIHGGGAQTRSICYVDDTVNGLIKLMNSSFQGPVNIGNPEEKSVMAWAQDIYNIVSKTKLDFVPFDADFISFNDKVEFLPADKDDPCRRCPDISLANDKLNWKPTIDSTEGLNRTIIYFSMII